MKLKYKKLHPDAKMPRNAYKNDTGYDVYAVEDPVITDTYIEYDLGISIEPPEGIHVELAPRSSITKTDLVLANSLGIIDNSYRGPMVARFKIVPRLTTDKDGNLSVSNKRPIIYHKGDKIAQLIIRKTENVEFELAEDLNETDRGNGGFGSSGK